MKRPSRHRGQVLILLSMWLFFGGGGASALVVYDRPASELKKAVKRVIADKERRDPILLDLKYWSSTQELRDEVIADDRGALFKALRPLSAQRSAVEPIIAKQAKTLRRMDLDFIALRFRIKDRVSREEWTQLAARGDSGS